MKTSGAIERCLVEFCSPTLARIKTASLFTLEAPSERWVAEQLECWNLCLEEKGVSLLLLRWQEGKALVYVCRLARLAADLKKPGAAAFLSAFGYTDLEARGALAFLRQRLEEGGDFPHEIGIFLGYPLCDVVGFIENAGQNSKCTGCWKVYCNECEAVKAFALYKKCKEVYLRHWRNGRSVWQLTVAA